VDLDATLTTAMAAVTAPVDPGQSDRPLVVTKTLRPLVIVRREVLAAIVPLANPAVTPPSQQRASAPVAHHAPVLIVGRVRVRTADLVLAQVPTVAVAPDDPSARRVLNSRR
jgi:hypothetical protein